MSDDARRGSGAVAASRPLRLSFDRLWTWIALLLPAFLALLVPMPAVDLAYQVRAGDEMLASRALPTVDTWTFTIPGTPWTDQQWLAQVALSIGHSLGGWELLAVLRAALVVAAVGLMLATARARGATPRTAAILALAGFAISVPALALRPQLFGIVLFALLVWLVSIRDRRPRALLVAPVIVLLWANLHGSFVLGPAILAYAWLEDLAAGRPSRGTFTIFALSMLATLVNPYAAGAWAYALNIGTNPAIANQVSEWQRTSPLAVPGILFYPSVLLAVLLMARRRAAFRWPDWMLLAGMAVLGAWAVRGVVWWSFVLVFLASAALARRGAVDSTTPDAADRASPGARRSLANGVIAVVLGILVVVALPWWRPSDPLTGRVGLLTYAPSRLATAVREASPGHRVAVPQTWASWFEWAARDSTYFIDSRFELFPADVWSDAAAVERGGSAASEVLDRRKVDVLVVAGTASPDIPGWAVRYTDADGILLERVATSSALGSPLR